MASSFGQGHPKDAHMQPPFKNIEEQNFPGSEADMNPRPDYGETSYRGFNRLQDKVALVTGGDSGIGRAVCVAYAKEGADIVCCYLPEEERDAQETRRVVEACGRRFVGVPCDLRLEDDCKKVIDTAVRSFGRIDILVNNAAFQGKAVESFEQIDRERVERTFFTNIIAMFSLCRYAVGHMQPGSAIINTGSIQAYQPKASILDYATTKGAIVNFTKGLAQELVDRGIRVNCIAPGPVWTPLVAQSFPKEHLQEFGKNNPMGRPAQPVEMAPGYVFLASHESVFVNGEILGQTGGKPLS